MRVVALAGGVGGAKLAQGLSQAVPTDDLIIIVNTGDDFDHFGLHICPDLDTVCYTLAGMANPTTGWGLIDETWQASTAIALLGGPSWFSLGDRDLGTHLERTRRLSDGQPLSQIVGEFCKAWGIGQRILPMTDSRVATIVQTHEMGDLPFQNYFVENNCKPRVKGFYFEGIEKAEPAPGVISAILNADLIVICPSNPWVSISPILAVKGIRNALSGKSIIAVSPIIGGQALKGPAAKMYFEMGIQPSALAVAEQYKGLISGFILDFVDQELLPSIEQSGIIPYATHTIMRDAADRYRLAQEVLLFWGEKIRRVSDQ